MKDVRIVEHREVSEWKHHLGKLELEVYRTNWCIPYDSPFPSGMETTAEEGNGKKTPVVIEAVSDTGKRLRVAAYCRVSTLFESQETSILSQRKHYEELIQSHREWDCAGIYLETGVSATSMERRPELRRLLSDCREKKIDLILTKSISRFARSTADCLEMIRLLNGWGVSIWFEKEHIQTRLMDSEFVVTILACLAENESRNLSENIKWGIRKRFQNGTYRQARAPYGYEWKNGQLSILPEQSVVVRVIFQMVLSGKGGTVIAKELNQKKVPGPSGKIWYPGTVRAIIRNPACIGMALYQKTWRDEDFRQRPNRGELELYRHEEHHAPIISRKEYLSAQMAVEQRAREVGYGNGADAGRSRHQYCFSGRLFCEECGAVMHRQTGIREVFWLCNRHARDLELCSMKPQSDPDLRNAFLNCLNKLSWSQSRKEETHRILEVYEHLLQRKKSGQYMERLEWIRRKTEDCHRESGALAAQFLQGRSRTEYQRRKMILEEELQILELEKRKILRLRESSVNLNRLKKTIAQWRITDDPEAFPEEIFSEFVEHCTVDSSQSVVFHFYCGLKLQETLRKREAL